MEGHTNTHSHAKVVRYFQTALLIDLMVSVMVILVDIIDIGNTLITPL
jgi:hypothetical protein